MAAVDLSSYEIILPYEENFDGAIKIIDEFNQTKEIIYKRITPKKIREIEIKQYIDSPVKINLLQNKKIKLNVDIKITLNGSIKPSEIIHILHEKFNLKINEESAKIHRTKLTSHGKNLLDIN